MNNLRHTWPLHFVLLITNWLPDNVIFLKLRGRLARPFFKKCGSNLRLGRNVVFYNPANISIGKDVYVAYGSWISAGDEIEIGDEVLFGPYNVVVSANHTRLDGSFRFGPPSLGKVVIEHGVWMGAHCTTTANSRVKRGSVVAANTVVRGTVDSDSIYAGGSLGRVVKKFNEA